MAGICLGDIHTQVLRNLLGNRCYDNAGIAIATTKTRAKTVNAISYSIDGVLYTKAGTDNLFVHTDVTVQAADTTKYYALCLDSSGNASIIQGTSTALPDIPATKCIVGALKVVTVAVTFTPATDNHDASGVTTTYYNLSCIPTAGIAA